MNNILIELALTEEEEKKLKSFYTKKFAEELHQMLGTPRKKASITATKLYKSAEMYIMAQKERDRELSPNQSVAIIKSLKSKVKKTLNTLDQLNQSLNLRHTLNHYSENLNTGEKLPENNGKDTLEQILSALEKMLIENPKEVYGYPKTQNLDFLIYQLKFLFDDSEIKFTQGKYYKKIGYISECLDILHHILQPVDHKITKSQISEAIKRLKD